MSADSHIHDFLFAEVRPCHNSLHKSCTAQVWVSAAFPAQALPLARLEDDWKLLGSLLDDCLIREIGPEMFAKVQKIRSMAHCASDLAANHDTVCPASASLGVPRCKVRIQLTDFMPSRKRPSTWRKK